jgi:hypothetical protein
MPEVASAPSAGAPWYERVFYLSVNPTGLSSRKASTAAQAVWRCVGVASAGGVPGLALFDRSLAWLFAGCRAPVQLVLLSCPAAGLRCGWLRPWSTRADQRFPDSVVRFVAAGQDCCGHLFKQLALEIGQEPGGFAELWTRSAIGPKTPAALDGLRRCRCAPAAIQRSRGGFRWWLRWPWSSRSRSKAGGAIRVPEPGPVSGRASAETPRLRPWIQDRRVL